MSSDLSLNELSDPYQLREPSLTEKVASEVLALFRTSVRSTLILTLALVAIDAAFIWYGIIVPDQRLITENVVMAIIGASIVQVGAALSAIVYSLFRKGAMLSEVE